MLDAQIKEVLADFALGSADCSAPGSEGCRPHCRGHDHRRGRRLQPISSSTSARCLFRTWLPASIQSAGTRPTARHYEGWQCDGTKCPVRGRLELQDDTEGRSVDEAASASSPQEIIDIAWKAQLRLHKIYKRLDVERQAFGGRDSRRGPRAAVLHLVDRTTGAAWRGSHRTSIVAIDIGQDVESGRGNPRICVGRANMLTSVARARQPSDAPSSWGIQPPNKSLSDRRVIRRPDPCRSPPNTSIAAARSQWVTASWVAS